MNLKKLMLLFLFVFSTTLLFSQGKITDFKHVLEHDGSGVVLVVKPLSFDPNQKDFRVKKYKYGMRVCYTFKGKTYAKRQDMTYDLFNEGEYSLKVAYGGKYKTGDVVVNDIKYFNMEDVPRDQWPTKEDCN